MQAADGTGSPQRLFSSPQTLPNTFSPDGRLAFTASIPDGYDVRWLEMSGKRESGDLLASKYNEQNVEVSPDGRCLAYQSNESGQAEIYVRPFPDVEGGRWQVSTGGGTRPAWARRTGELFYLAPDGAMMSVVVRPKGSFEAGNPQKLFAGRYFTLLNGRTYDVTADGQRFLMIKDSVARGQHADASHRRRKLVRRAEAAHSGQINSVGRCPTGVRLGSDWGPSGVRVGSEWGQTSIR